METLLESMLVKYIYKITNTINQKVYIGQTYDINGRWAKHRYMMRHGSTRHLYSAMRKYGEENFTIEVIEECPVEIADNREVFWIMFYNSIDRQYGYNETPGGTGQIKYIFDSNRAEMSKKLSKALKGHAVSVATREKLSKKFKRS